MPNIARGEAMKAKLKMKNILTNEVVEVHPTIEHADSLYYNLAVWVDEENNSYGQCRFGVPLGFELIEITRADKVIHAGPGRTFSPDRVRRRRTGTTREKNNEL